MNAAKQGQLEMTFNWVYILIAGVVIILFFVSIALKQKTVSEQQLSIDIVRIMESIFTSAGASEKTKNFIETSGLADYTLYFKCEDGVSEYGIKDGAVKVENSVNPVFSPAEIQTSKLILWSLPYKMPFKVTDFLYVTSINTKYFVYGISPFADEFEANAEGLNIERITSLDQISPGKNYQVRIIDVDGVMGQQRQFGMSAELSEMDDDKVTAVSFIADSSVDFYQKQGTSWRKTNLFPIHIISLGDEKNAAKYAAIFAADGQQYQCNMQKAFQRLQYVSEVYLGKFQQLKNYYTEQRSVGKAVGDCLGHISEYNENMEQSLGPYPSRAASCSREYSVCSSLPELAVRIRTTNNNLGRDCGVTVY